MKRFCIILALLLAVGLAGCAKDSGAENTLQQPTATELNLSPAYRETTQPKDTDATGEAPEAVRQTEPADSDFVRIRDYIPDEVCELPYASRDNFTGDVVYDFTEPFLRYGTVKKLTQVQQELKQGGMFLKIWDGFRPTSAQYTLWEAFPNANYVSNPDKGFSSHSRGNTVDVTLVYADGSPVIMPTGYDDFTPLADRDYSDCEPGAAANAVLLERIMESYGFTPYFGEWWHFSDTKSYPIEESFTPAPGYPYFAQCSEYISLRSRPDTGAEVLCTIPAGEEFELIAWYGSFAMVLYQDAWGYVLREYVAPVEVG